MTSRPAQSQSAINGAESWVSRNWRWLAVSAIAFLAIVTVVTAIVLPPWLVSLSAASADANTKLNAVTATRGSLLGILTPLVVAAGGVAALLNYRETVSYNRRMQEMQLQERDENRRIRRAAIYADLVATVEECVKVARLVYLHNPLDKDYVGLVDQMIEKRHAVTAAQTRVRLLGSDDMHTAVQDLVSHCDDQCREATKKPPKAEWDKLANQTYSYKYVAFVKAARADLAPTR